MEGGEQFSEGTFAFTSSEAQPTHPGPHVVISTSRASLSLVPLWRYSSLVPLKLQPGQWVTAASIARHLVVSGALVRYWIRKGWLPAVQVQAAHYSDDRPRKGKRAEWRIAAADWERFLTRYRAGRP